MLDPRVALAVKGAISVALCVLLIVGTAQVVGARPANIRVYIPPRIITVDDDGPADYHVIQDAIDAANYGDTVLVMPGRYYQYQERVVPGYGSVRANVFLKSGVRLRGSGANVTHIEANAGDDAHSGYPVFAYQVNNALMDGFHITGHYENNPHYQFSGWGVTCISSNVEISNSIIDGYIPYPPPGGCRYFETGLILENSRCFVHNNVVFYCDDTNVISKNNDASWIHNNTIHCRSANAIVVINSTPEIANNIIVGGDHGIQCYNSDPMIYTNDIWDYYFEPYYGCGPGVGDIYQDPDFASDPIGNDFNFHLRLGSPCIDAGTNVGLPYNGNAPDIGAFEFPEVPSEIIGLKIFRFSVTSTLWDSTSWATPVF